MTTLKNYTTQIAGRLWSFPSVKISTDHAGRQCLSIEEIEKINKAVAMEVCGETRPLSLEEFEFLVDLTSSKNTQMAEAIYCEPSAISNWRKRQIKTLPQLESNVLRKFFWGKIFGDGIPAEKLNCIMYIGKEITHLKEESGKNQNFKVLKSVS